MYELLRDAHELVPGVSELEIEELSVGLRPGTPDNAPAIGPAAVDGLIWATGHYRNGILLAPLTAELVLGVLAGEHQLDGLLPACAPERFALDDGGGGGGGGVVIVLNGERSELRAGETLAELLLGTGTRRGRTRRRGGGRRRGRPAGQMEIVRAGTGRARRGADGDAGRMMRACRRL